MSRIFLDTNILVYSQDDGVPAKRDIAARLLLELQGRRDQTIISTQVLQEYYNTLTGKLRFTPAEGRAKLLLLADIETVAIVPELIFAAIELHARGSISFWDSLIVAAAQAADCDELWTEDMQEGQMFGSLRVVNPFEGPQ